MAHVFISYARRDIQYVLRLAEFLTNQSIDVWYDLRTEPAAAWLPTIAEKIETCGAFVVVVTPHSNDSSWVRRECQHAEDHGRLIVPLWLTGDELPIQLKDIEAVPVPGGRMPDTDTVEFLRSACRSPRPAVRRLDLIEPVEVSTLTGHTGPVLAVAYASEGPEIASGGWDNEVRTWHAEYADSRRRLVGPAETVFGLAYSPHRPHLAAAYRDGTVVVWDVTTGAKVHDLRYAHTVMAVTYTADALALVACLKDGTVRLWDVTAATERAVLKEHVGPVMCAASGPDARSLVTGGADGSLRLWNLPSDGSPGTQVGRVGSMIFGVAYARDGRAVATASADGVVRTWRLSTHEVDHEHIGHNGAVHAVRYTPDGKYLASGGQDGTIRIWDAASGEVCYVIDAQAGPVQAIDVAPSGTYLAAACGTGVVRMWRVARWVPTRAQ